MSNLLEFEQELEKLVQYFDFEVEAVDYLDRMLVD